MDKLQPKFSQGGIFPRSGMHRGVKIICIVELWKFILKNGEGGRKFIFRAKYNSKKLDLPYFHHQ